MNFYCKQKYYIFILLASKITATRLMREMQLLAAGKGLHALNIDTNQYTSPPIGDDLTKEHSDSNRENRRTNLSVPIKDEKPPAFDISPAQA